MFDCSIVRTVLPLFLVADTIFTLLLCLVHELVDPVHERDHVFIRFVLCQTYTHRQVVVRSRLLIERFPFEIRPDSFSRKRRVLTCCHGQNDSEFFTAITICRIRLTQSPFGYLAEP